MWSRAKSVGQIRVKRSLTLLHFSHSCLDCSLALMWHIFIAMDHIHRTTETTDGQKESERWWEMVGDGGRWWATVINNRHFAYLSFMMSKKTPFEQKMRLRTEDRRQKSRWTNNNKKVGDD